MSLPDIGRYRRRFIVEFGPEDSGLVDRMGVVHRTKRAAIIAGLRLLESGELDTLRERVLALEASEATASKALAAERAKARDARAALATARDELKAERATLRATRQTLRATQEERRDAQAQVAAVEAEYQRLAALLPRHAYCGACDKLVPDAEWAEEAARGGYDVYHQPDGYRAKGTLARPATVLFWRATRQSQP